MIYDIAKIISVISAVLLIVQPSGNSFDRERRKQKRAENIRNEKIKPAISPIFFKKQLLSFFENDILSFNSGERTKNPCIIITNFKILPNVKNKKLYIPLFSRILNS